MMMLPSTSSKPRPRITPSAHSPASSHHVDELHAAQQRHRHRGLLPAWKLHGSSRPALCELYRGQLDGVGLVLGQYRHLVADLWMGARPLSRISIFSAEWIFPPYPRLSSCMPPHCHPVIFTDATAYPPLLLWKPQGRGLPSREDYRIEGGVNGGGDGNRKAQGR